MSLQRYINRVPVYVELDRPEERAFAIQALYRQTLNIMDVVETGGLINIQSDWNAEAGSAAEILHKPTGLSAFTNDCGFLVHNDITDLVDTEAFNTESLFQKNLSAIMSLAVDPNAGVTIVTTNPEWKLVYTDAEDRILLGKKQDNSWYFATDLDTILDTIISGYTTT